MVTIYWYEVKRKHGPSRFLACCHAPEGSTHNRSCPSYGSVAEDTEFWRKLDYTTEQVPKPDFVEDYVPPDPMVRPVSVVGSFSQVFRGGTPQSVSLHDPRLLSDLFVGQLYVEGDDGIMRVK